MTKWYQKTSGIVALLILFFPVGLYMMWRYTTWHKSVKISISILAAIATISIMATSQSTTTKQQVNNVKSQQQSPKTEAKFEGTVLNYEAINPASLRVAVEVKNAGNAEGRFSCTIRGKDTSSTYTGFDTFEDEGGTLAPDASRKFSGVITITKQGAEYVNDVSVSCN